MITITGDFKRKILLAGCSLFVGFLFLYVESQLPITQNGKHGTGHAWLAEAYAFYKHGISNVVGSSDFIAKNFTLIDVPQEQVVFQTVSIYDPIAFSAACALLWRAVGMPNLLILKIINILIFSILTILLFQTLRILFHDKKYAFIGTLGALSYLPLAYQNIENVRDIYHYYFFIIFLYFVLSYAFEKRQTVFLIPGIVAFSFCQWVRPCILSSLVVLTVIFLVFSFFYFAERKRIFFALISFWIGSILLFWIPFCVFNKVTYGKYYVVPKGEGMLGSLYGVPFPDGDFVDHSTGKFVLRKTGHQMRCGSTESDNVCMDLYKEYTAKYPLHALKCMAIRFKQMLWYDLPWREYDPYTVTTEVSRWFKFKLMLTSPALFLEFFARLYVRILLILGYLGIFLAFIRKEYRLLVFMIVGVVFSSGYSWLFHIEERVLVVHSWPFGIFAAYFLGYCHFLLRSFFRNKYQQHKRMIIG